MMKERGTTLTKQTSTESFTARRLVKRAVKQANATRISMLQYYAKLMLKASTPTSMREE